MEPQENTQITENQQVAYPLVVTQQRTALSSRSAGFVVFAIFRGHSFRFLD
jgi:hypothetical protein